VLRGRQETELPGSPAGPMANSSGGGKKPPENIYIYNVSTPAMCVLSEQRRSDEKIGGSQFQTGIEMGHGDGVDLRF
jgi:hypothetical protein